MSRLYSKKIRKQKRQKTKRMVIIGVIVIFLVLYVSRFSLSFFANGADYILRPIIGSRNTVVVESLFFGVSDTTKQVAYKFILPSKNVFASENTKTTVQTSALSSNTRLMELSSIPFLTLEHPHPDEGKWQPILFNRFLNNVVMAKTIVSPDSQRPYAYVALVKMAMSKLGIGVAAGTVQPGGPIGNPGSGKVPSSIAANNQLIAAFDGGFQYKDGAYGMTIGKKTYVPLQDNLATLVIYNDGSVNIINYKGQNISDTIATRQNGPMLIENGSITPYTENGRDTWGLTVTNSMYTWRSGIGVTKNGNLIYAIGPSLVPRTLAKALQASGAINAMQLDINPYWVRFELYKPQAQGGYSYKPLLENMAKGGYSYLHGYQKDFFYIYKK